MPEFAPRAVAINSARALSGNLSALAARSGTPLLMPVKADAYGHGLEIIARLAAPHPDVWGFAVATPPEALVILSQNPGKPVLLITPPFPGEYGRLADLGIHIPVSTLSEAEALPAHARAHLKVDTGMNRIGARPEEAVAVGLRLHERGLLAGIYSHFASSDDEDLTYTHEQIKRFQSVLNQLPPALTHISSSGGVLSLGKIPGMHLSRPGMATYGYAPPHLKQAVPLTPVMTVQAQVTHIHHARTGESVGYNNLWHAPRPTTLAVVGMGYADGYPRNATGQASVMVQGQRRPIVGRICMDQFMLDVTGLNVQVGDWLELWGSGEITGLDVAGWGGTNEYELLTGVGNRVERRVGDVT